MIPVLALLAALTGCGDQTASGPSGPPGSAGWVVHDLAGTPSLDHAPLLETDHDAGVLVAFLSDDGVLQTTRSTDEAAFEAGTPLPTGLRFAGLGGAVRHDGGWLVLGSGGSERVHGDEQAVFEPFALRSADGLTWAPQPTTGLTGPAEVAGVVAVGDRLVAVGTRRDARDPSMGGFSAAAWISDDGVAWRDVALPGVTTPDGPGDYDHESVGARVVPVGDRLVAAGRVGDTAAVWVSDDAGATWRIGSLDGVEGRLPFQVAGLAVGAEGGVVATLDDGRVMVSGDAGDTWRVSAERPGPPGTGVDGYAPLWSAGGRYWVSASTGGDPVDDLATCHVDPRTGCPDPQARDGLYVSDDGDRWTRVSTDGLPGYGDGVPVHDLGEAPDGGLVALGSDEDGHSVVSTLAAGVDLPAEPEPTLPTADVTFVPDSGPEVGVRYAVPIYLHCGSEWLYLGEEPWQRVGREWSDPRGGGGQSYGFATLVSRDRLEYTDADGERLAFYETTDEQPPGCD